MKTLTRPMFRMGGTPVSDGVGITSGLNRNNYAHGTEGHIEDIQKKIMEKPKYGFTDVMADAYETSKGATDWRDWINQASDKALEYRAKEDARPAEQLEQLIKIQTGKTNRLKATTDPTIVGRQNMLVKVTEMINTWKNANPGGSVEDFLESGNQLEIDAYIRGANPSFPGIASVLAQIENLMSDFTSVNRDSDPINNVDDQTIQAERERLLQSLIGRYLSIGNAHGGKPIRRGYNMGAGPAGDYIDENVQMSEQINTPQGDMSMTEDVNVLGEDPMAAGAGTADGEQDVYKLLRDRLPEEIPDDVVRLIAYNPDAFADFASIESQEDIMAFNQTYGVELVLNTDQL
jgi:hypothetical protein